MSSFQTGLDLGKEFIEFALTIIAGSIGFLLPFFILIFAIVSVIVLIGLLFILFEEKEV